MSLHTLTFPLYSTIIKDISVIKANSIKGVTIGVLVACTYALHSMKAQNLFNCFGSLQMLDCLVSTYLKVKTRAMLWLQGSILDRQVAFGCPDVSGQT